MKKELEKFFSSKLPKIVFFSLIAVFCALPVASQSAGNENFPNGSPQGTTEMSERITGIDFPNIEFSASFNTRAQ